jgi:hypothetical protein
MGLGDCPKCWDGMCSCGYEYRNWSIERIDSLVEKLSKVKAY